MFIHGYTHVLEKKLALWPGKLLRVDEQSYNAGSVVCPFIK
jgi:hypothetical protein